MRKDEKEIRLTKKLLRLWIRFLRLNLAPTSHIWTVEDRRCCCGGKRLTKT